MNLCDLFIVIQFNWFSSDRLKNGEKDNDLVWESWNAAESDPEDSESCYSSYDDQIPQQKKSLSLPSAMRYGSCSIPPSPVLLAKNEVSIPRSKSDEADIGKQKPGVNTVVHFHIRKKFYHVSFFIPIKRFPQLLCWTINF